MSVKPPHNAPPANPRALDVLDRVQQEAPRGFPTRTPERFAPPVNDGSHDPRPAEGRPAPRTAAAVRDRAERWQSNHAPPAAREAPDQGEVLARLPRPDGTELRVSLHTYQGRPFLRVAPWQRGEGDAWWPVKGKGCTVKVRELAAVASALCDAMDRTDDDGSRG